MRPTGRSGLQFDFEPVDVEDVGDVACDFVAHVNLAVGRGVLGKVVLVAGLGEARSRGHDAAGRAAAGHADPAKATTATAASSNRNREPTGRALSDRGLFSRDLFI
ncbi:hypothetical protein [Candidatus Poriferisodalis sp.]|uniref:hypothetical protein n=1 Tax=Candidatus Poriferisodalis sp. TaxID=3101277 RepID=UPI003B5B78A9